jgi:hypothetical protein
MTIVSELTPAVANHQVSFLQPIAAGLMSSLSANAFRNKNILVNNIPDDLCINTNPEIVASVLAGILTAVTNHSKENLITVSAKTYSDVVLIHVKDYNSHNGHGLDKHLQEVQLLAEKIGGFVNETSRRQHTTTIAFSFTNLSLQ